MQCEMGWSGVGLDWEGGMGLGVMGAMLSLDWG